MQETINYLINFLLGESNSELSSDIGYTSDQQLFSQYKVVIIPSPFFDKKSYGKTSSIPTLPLSKVNDIPLLYGSPKIEKIKNTLVVHADIIASSYFLLSRYEEWLRPDCRDTHGRFSGKESLAYRANFLHRPIVEEYGKLLLKWLNESGSSTIENNKNISKVYLTHDVDEVYRYRDTKSFLKTLIRSFYTKEGQLQEAFRSFFGKIEDDPLFTFPWIFKTNNQFKQEAKKLNIETIFFFKSLISYLPEDKPYYNLFLKDTQYLFKLCDINEVEIGLHASYLSGDNPEMILEEKEQLEIASGNSIQYNRHHFLRLKNVADTESLYYAGISDDFTMGYADIAGFRLGTCKPVNWINLQTKEVTALTLHPLCIMDRTLEDKRYMNFNYNEALSYSKNLIDKVAEYNGELILLWHNSSLCNKFRFSQKQLYSELLKYITSKQ